MASELPHTHLEKCPRKYRTPNYKIHFGKGSYFSNSGLKIVFNCLKKKSDEYSDGDWKKGLQFIGSTHLKIPQLGKGTMPRARMCFNKSPSSRWTVLFSVAPVGEGSQRRVYNVFCKIELTTSRDSSCTKTMS